MCEFSCHLNKQLQLVRWQREEEAKVTDAFVNLVKETLHLSFKYMEIPK